MSFIVRYAGWEDLQALLDLYTHLNDNKPTQIDERVESVWRSMLSRPNQYILLGDENGQIVSSLSLTIISSLTHGQRPFAVIEYVVTHSEHRGNGYAGKLIEKAEEIAKSRNCYKIMLITGHKEESVHKLYKKCGFSSEGKTAYVKEI
ncbi:MAG: GNAT family N-acetyltransferase [Clostridiales bacterium]|nr:GNAT family N-acetyltransferase [Clostridiales bacterium]